MSPADMERRIIRNTSGILTTTVNDIEHIESQSLMAIGIVKIYFQPDAKIDKATAQVTAISQTAIRADAPGHSAAADHQLQRVQRADSSACSLRQRSLGNATQ